MYAIVGVMYTKKGKAINPIRKIMLWYLFLQWCTTERTKGNNRGAGMKGRKGWKFIGDGWDGVDTIGTMTRHTAVATYIPGTFCKIITVPLPS